LQKNWWRRIIVPNIIEDAARQTVAAERESKTPVRWRSAECWRKHRSLHAKFLKSSTDARLLKPPRTVVFGSVPAACWLDVAIGVVPAFALTPSKVKYLIRALTVDRKLSGTRRA
jgi:hypothetical protein